MPIFVLWFILSRLAWKGMILYFLLRFNIFQTRTSLVLLIMWPATMVMIRKTPKDCAHSFWNVERDKNCKPNMHWLECACLYANTQVKMTKLNIPLRICMLNQHCKNIRRFYRKITGNQLPVHFPFFLQAPVNIFRNQALYGRKGHVLFLVI